MSKFQSAFKSLGTPCAAVKVGVLAIAFSLKIFIATVEQLWIYKITILLKNHITGSSFD